MKQTEKFVPYEKLSKRRKRELDRKKRGSWNGVNPVTRTAESKKVYHRKRIPMPNDGGDPFFMHKTARHSIECIDL